MNTSAFPDKLKLVVFATEGYLKAAYVTLQTIKKLELHKHTVIVFFTDKFELKSILSSLLRKIATYFEINVVLAKPSLLFEL